MALIIILAVLAAAWILSYRWLNKEVASEVEVRNPKGDTGSALVVYHPGPGTFHRQVVAGFVQGLVADGCRVKIASASNQAPEELEGYDLLVLGSPTYWFTPSVPVRRYLRQVGDLGGLPTVTIITGLGAGGRSSKALQRCGAERPVPNLNSEPNSGWVTTYLASRHNGFRWFARGQGEARHQDEPDARPQ